MEECRKIIFVDASDTGRAAMAKIMMRQRLRGATPEVLSRGLVVLFPEPMNQKAEAVLVSNGYSGKEHRAAQLLQEDIEPETLILTMEDEQKLKIWEDYENVPRVYRFTDFVGESGDLPPLYWKPLTEYGACCEWISVLVDKLIEKIKGTKEAG